MQELKATKVKEKNSLEVELLATLVAHPLPLADFFTSDFFFSILPDIISNNTQRTDTKDLIRGIKNKKGY